MGNVLTDLPTGAPPGTAPLPRLGVLDALEAPDFEAIRRNGTLSLEQRTAIGDYIRTITAGPPIGPPVTPRIARIRTLAATPAIGAYYNI